MMDMAAKAHLQKKDFIAKLMVPGGPMWQTGMVAEDGKPYIELDKATYIIGILGLNECVKYAIGEDLHDSEEAYKDGIKVISAMYLKVKELEKKHNLHFTLEETPGESTSLRFAKVDTKEFPDSRDFVRGDLEKGEVYYTNSIHLTPDAPADIFERIEKQGKFNTLIESGCITHVFLGEQKPDPKSIFKLIQRTWETTQSAQITISPEFTVCEDCNRTTRGYKREVTDEKWEKQNVATAAQQTYMG
jgi:anaerobic ribonucleoside-triphosphate reductase